MKKYNLKHISDDILKDLADNLETGFRSYVHRDTHEIVSVPDPDRFFDIDMEVWKESYDRIKKQRKEFLVIEIMDTSSSFRMMRDFVYSLEDGKTKERLTQAIEGYKPFANFNQSFINLKKESVGLLSGGQGILNG
jgi:hypothetical protein